MDCCFKVYNVYMEKNATRIIYQRTDGKWVTTVVDDAAVSSLHNTKQGAENYARKKLEHSGGGSLVFRTGMGTVHAGMKTDTPGKGLLSGLAKLLS